MKTIHISIKNYIKILCFLLLLSMTACLPKRSSSQEDSTSCRIYLDICVEKNFLLNRYDVDVYYDGEMLTKIKHGKSYERLMETQVGNHTLEFFHHDNYNVKGKTSVKIEGDMTWSCTLENKGSKIKVKEILTRDFITDERLARLESVKIKNVKLDEEAGAEVLIDTFPKEAVIKDVKITIENNDVASAKITDKVISIIGKKAGRTKATVTLTDSENKKIEVTFKITVNEITRTESSTQT